MPLAKAHDLPDLAPCFLPAGAVLEDYAQLYQDHGGRIERNIEAVECFDLLRNAEAILRLIRDDIYLASFSREVIAHALYNQEVEVIAESYSYYRTVTKEVYLWQQFESNTDYS